MAQNIGGSACVAWRYHRKRSSSRPTHINRNGIDHFDEIKNALGYWDKDVDLEISAEMSDDRIVVASTNPIETLNGKVSRLISENVDLNMRMRRHQNVVKGLIDWLAL